MKTYVVSYISFYNNDLLSTVISSSKSEVDALLQGIYALSRQDLGKPVEGTYDQNGFFYEQDGFLSELADCTVEEIKTACFDCDMAVNIIEISGN